MAVSSSGVAPFPPYGTPKLPHTATYGRVAGRSIVCHLDESDAGAMVCRRLAYCSLNTSPTRTMGHTAGSSIRSKSAATRGGTAADCMVACATGRPTAASTPAAAGVPGGVYVVTSNLPASGPSEPRRVGYAARTASMDGTLRLADLDETRRRRPVLGVDSGGDCLYLAGFLETRFPPACMAPEPGRFHEGAADPALVPLAAAEAASPEAVAADAPS
mmetsp:Transcript_2165/g.6650  ORF Transcript_2165/g.6650 Transcript_2165/m.6650 type:complete len:217 (-) Transcript_2165:153-803(-)